MNFVSRWMIAGAGALVAMAGVLVAGCGADVETDCNSVTTAEAACMPAVTGFTQQQCKDIAATANTSKCADKITKASDCVLAQANVCDPTALAACSSEIADESSCLTVYCAAHGTEAGCVAFGLSGG
jgi:hypothetical protein